MKNTLYFCLSLFVLVMACKKPYDYDNPTTTVYSEEKLNQAINGTWVMNTATQIDEKSVVKESIDITDFFLEDGAKAPNINFNTANYTFSVDTAGLKINYFTVANGKWRFDDVRYPTQIILTDMQDASIGSVAITSNLLGLAPTIGYISGASCSGALVMKSNVSFIKSN